MPGKIRGVYTFNRLPPQEDPHNDIMSAFAALLFQAGFKAMIIEYETEYKTAPTICEIIPADPDGPINPENIGSLDLKLVER